MKKNNKPNLKRLILTIFLLILTSAGFATNTNRNTSPAFSTNSIHAISLIHKLQPTNHETQCRRHGITGWKQKLASDPRFVGRELGTALTLAFTAVNSAINAWDRMAARAMEAERLATRTVEAKSSMSTQNRNGPWFHKIEMSLLEPMGMNKQETGHTREKADGA